MRFDQSRTRLHQALLACACGALLIMAGAATVSAQQATEDEDTIEQKIIKNILGGMGVDVGRAGIEYRERSPLVIPPTRDLPPPAGSDLSAGNPAWPREPQRKLAVQNKPNVRATSEDPGSDAALTPDELRRGTNPRAGRVTEPSRSADEAGRPMRPNELGTTGIFSWNALMGTHLDERGTFTGEPARSNLTQPPPGYQTPSPSYPYGVGSERGGGWKIPNILDRAVGSD